MTDDYINNIIQHYDDRADERSQHFMKSSAEQIFATLSDFLPAASGDVADIGAGAGRDTQWLAQQGHRVTAVEPAPRLRHFGKTLTQDLAVTWLDDRLPDLPLLCATGQRFDFIFLNAVWMFVPIEMRPQALTTLARLLKPQGTLCLAIRRGPPTPGRVYLETKDDEFTRLAPDANLTVTFQATLPDSQNRPDYTWLTVCLTPSPK